MRIDRNLNICFPVDTPNGTIYVHSAPIAREIFERHYLILGKTFTYIMVEGLGVVQGPNSAALLLRDIAKDTIVPGRRDAKGRAMNAWEGPDGVERGLFAEIRRLTNVVVPGDHGFDTIPYEVALGQGRIDDEDASAIDNVLAFFTVASSGARSQADSMTRLYDGLKALWAVETTSLDSTEYAASLTTSTAADLTTAKPASAPSSITSLPTGRGNSSAAIPI